MSEWLLNYFAFKMHCAVSRSRIRVLPLSICEGREFIESTARNKCLIENIMLMLKTKAEH